MIDPFLLAAGMALAWCEIAERVPLDPDGKAPFRPHVQCRTCGKVGVPVYRSTGRLFSHARVEGGDCLDGGTYHAEVDAWDQSEEPWVE